MCRELSKVSVGADHTTLLCDYVIILQTDTMAGTPTLPWPMLGEYAGALECSDQSQQPSSHTGRAQASSYNGRVFADTRVILEARVRPPQHSLTVSWTCQWAVSALVRESPAYVFAKGKMEGKGEGWWMWNM
jgi:hypothetical protein